MSSFLVRSTSSPRIKFGVDPAPAPLEGEQHVDNLQDLIQRKREMQKNKSKFHLSEADCNLLLTNANEFQYKDHQVIVQEGQELPSVYRIKSGKVNIVKGGVPVSVISQGWFLGETLFLNGRSCVYDASLVASGPVTIAELNLSFVKKLFDLDHVSLIQANHPSFLFASPKTKTTPFEAFWREIRVFEIFEFFVFKILIRI